MPNHILKKITKRLFYNNFFFRLFPSAVLTQLSYKNLKHGIGGMLLTPAVPLSGQGLLVLIKILKMRFLILKKYISRKSHCLKGPVTVFRLFLAHVNSVGQSVMLVTPRLWVQCPYRHSLELDLMIPVDPFQPRISCEYITLSLSTPKSSF